MIPQPHKMASAIFHLLLLLILLLLLSPSTTAETNQNISLGSSLSTDKNTSWASPSGDFAFGFYQLGAGNGFLLAILFNKISDKTVVWSANRNSPVQGGSKVELTSDGRFVLTNQKGEEAWTANTTKVAYAAMLDTGNFVLVSTMISGNYSWESFDNPTDTILPTQVLSPGTQLRSRLKETNYSAGRFNLDMQTDGNLVFYQVNIPTGYEYDAYWSSDTTGHSTKLIFNESGYIYVDQQNGSSLHLVPMGSVVSTRDYYQRATLDFDGALRQYIYPKTSQSAGGPPPESWTVMLVVPSDICYQIIGTLGSGACGFNSYCKLNGTSWPICECPPGYSFIDPLDTFSGCKQEQEVVNNCDGRGEEFVLSDLPNVDWPIADFERMQPINEYDCREACLSDCLCVVAVYRDGTCWKKKLPLYNGREDPRVGGKALIKVSKANSSAHQPLPPLGAPHGKNARDTLIIILSIVLGSSALLNLIMISPISPVNSFFRHRKLLKNHSDSSIIGTNLRSFTYKELMVSTDGFKQEIGRGSFGTVYKGVLALDSEIFVAVKRLDKVMQEGEKEFRTEVSVIGQTHHKNLVRLLGFCDEGPHRLLVYEFMSNGSLASYLFGIIKPNWNHRVEIALSIAKGLTYLHEECSSQIIHCDIKPQNVLLDDLFIARISDFGLAKLLKSDQSRTSTGIRGTRGYVAPEWFRRTSITAKVDVYSFGVMLLEIICCRKSVELEPGREDEAILVDWAYDTYREGRMDALVGNDEEAMDDVRRLERFVMVAIWCVQEEPSLRPHMRKVIMMLEGVMEVSIPPNPNSFSFLN